MEDTTNTLIGLLCLAAICLIPLAGAAGGFLFYRRRKKAAAQDTPAPPFGAGASAASVAAVPPAPLAERPAAAPTPAVALDLAPSELVYLRGERFVQSAGVMNSEQLLGSGARVNGPALAAAVLATALLSLERSGVARLEPGTRKTMLGLKEMPTLYLVPSGRPSPYPDGSYEWKFLAAAQAAQVKRQNSLDHLVWYVLGRADTVPWMLVFPQLRAALAKRGILSASKAMMGLSVKYDLPESTAAVIAHADVEGLRRLLESAAADPERWKLFHSEIHEGIRRRSATQED
jgi:hypothetical protein